MSRTSCQILTCLTLLLFRLKFYDQLTHIYLQSHLEWEVWFYIPPVGRFCNFCHQMFTILCLLLLVLETSMTIIQINFVCIVKPVKSEPPWDQLLCLE